MKNLQMAVLQSWRTVTVIKKLLSSLILHFLKFQAKLLWIEKCDALLNV